MRNEGGDAVFIQEAVITGNSLANEALKGKMRRPKTSRDNYVTIFLPDRMMKQFREMQQALHLTASELGRRMMQEKLQHYAEERRTERERAASRVMQFDVQMEMPKEKEGADK